MTCVILILTLTISEITKNPDTTLFHIIDEVLLLILAFVGLLEVFHYVGWDIFVPSFMLNKHKDELSSIIKTYLSENTQELTRRITKETIEEYYEQEIKYISGYSDQKIQFIISQLGINVNQFSTIRLELLKMRCSPLKNLVDAESKIKQIIKCGHPIVVNLKKIPSVDRTYNQVDYYLNFNDVMYIDESCRELSRIMHLLICYEIGIDNFDRIVIPFDGNAILGFEVSKLLGKPLIKMRQVEGRIRKDQCWEGKINYNDKLLIVHDVLVSGNQIEHIYNNIPKCCSIIGLCCLVVRNDSDIDGMNKLQEYDTTIKSVLSISDKDIENILKGDI